MSVCPDNSTECLLRALVDVQNSYNWNPLTFAFTVAIGVLAFVVASLTVFQGALAAGPGRLKASHAAIGDFANYSKSQLSVREFRVRTTAWVPYLNERTWRRDGGFLYARDYGPRYSSENYLNRTFVQIPEDVPMPRHTYAGGWANLLSEFHGGQQSFQNDRNSIDSLIPINMDYLPGDIAAAPTLGSIETIVTLAAFAGCDEITVVNDLPLARGNNLQLSFREHPLLGLVAVFQRFPGGGTYCSQETVNTLFEDSYLNPDPDMRPFLSTLTLSQVDSLLGRTLRIVFECRVRWPRAFPSSAHNISSIAKSLCHCSEAWKHIDSFAIIAALKIYCDSKSAELVWSSWSRYSTSSRFRFLVYFPSDRRNLATPIHNHPLLALESFRKIDHASAAHSHVLHVLDGLYVMPDQPDDMDKMLNLATSDFYNMQTAIKPEHNRQCLIILPDAISICIEWLQFPNFWKDLDFERRGSVRGLLKYQLHEVGYFLATFEERDAKTQETGALMKDVFDLPGYILDPNTSPTYRTSDLDPKSSTSVESHLKQLTPKDGLRALLIFRAVLFGAFCSTCTDTSCVAGTELGRRVVNFL